MHGRAGHVTKSEVLLAEFSFNDFSFFFFIDGGGRLVGRGALSPLENGDRERWPPHPGYSQLGGVGQVEPDK